MCVCEFVTIDPALTHESCSGLVKVKFTEVLDLVKHREVIVKGVSIFLILNGYS